MSRRRVVLLLLASLLVSAPLALVAMDRMLPTADAPPGTPAGAVAAAKRVCGSPPFGRLGRIAPGPHRFEVRVTCTWTRFGRRNFETTISCAEGSWNGPIGWSDWGALEPCDQSVVGARPTVFERRRG